jgi:hypothetical protein
LDKETTQTPSDPQLQVREAENSCIGLNRRSFVKRSGKALYFAPTLALLSSAKVSAQGSDCPNPENPFCPTLDEGLPALDEGLDSAPVPDK